MPRSILGHRSGPRKARVVDQLASKNKNFILERLRREEVIIAADDEEALFLPRTLRQLGGNQSNLAPWQSPPQMLRGGGQTPTQIFHFKDNSTESPVCPNQVTIDYLTRFRIIIKYLLTVLTIYPRDVKINVHTNTWTLDTCVHDGTIHNSQKVEAT